MLIMKSVREFEEAHFNKLVTVCIRVQHMEL